MRRIADDFFPHRRRPCRCLRTGGHIAPFPVDHDLLRQLRSDFRQLIALLPNKFANHPGLFRREVNAVVTAGPPASEKIAALQRAGKRPDIEAHGPDRLRERLVTLRNRRKCVTHRLRIFRKKLLILAVS